MGVKGGISHCVSAGQNTHTLMIISQNTGVCQLDWEAFQKSPRVLSRGRKSREGDKSQGERG